MVELKLTKKETEALIVAVATVSIIKMPNEEMQGHLDSMLPDLKSLVGKVSDAQKVSGFWDEKAHP